MTRTLTDLATIQTGVYGSADPEGSVLYLQAKHFDEFGQLHDWVKPELLFDAKAARHLLDKGDILLAAKGHKNFATVIRSSEPPSVASSTFLVVRIRQEAKGEVSADYLAWFINQPQSQAYLKSNAIGSSLPSISIATLGDLVINIPDRAIQDKIVRLQELKNREKAIKAQLEERRDYLFQRNLLKLTQPQ